MIGAATLGRPIAMAQLQALAGSAGIGDAKPLLAQAAAPTIATATVVGSGTANTKGSWTEIVASTSVAADGLVLYIGVTSSATTDTSALLDIGIGAAGSEVTVVPNLQVGWRNSNAGQGQRIEYVLPVSVPKGSRIAARVQGVQTSKSVVAGVSLVAYSKGIKVPSALVDVGSDAATSNGVTVTSGSTTTKGAWAQIGSAPQALRALIVSVGGAAGQTTLANGYSSIDVGVGASGAQETIISDLHLQTQANEHVLQSWPSVLPCRVPSGATLWCRHAGDAGSRVIGVNVIGVPA